MVPSIFNSRCLPSRRRTQNWRTWRARLPWLSSWNTRIRLSGLNCKNCDLERPPILSMIWVLRIILRVIISKCWKMTINLLRHCRHQLLIPFIYRLRIQSLRRTPWCLLRCPVIWCPHHFQSHNHRSKPRLWPPCPCLNHRLHLHLYHHQLLELNRPKQVKQTFTSTKKYLK